MLSEASSRYDIQFSTVKLSSISFLERDFIAFDAYIENIAKRIRRSRHANPHAGGTVLCRLLVAEPNYAMLRLDESPQAVKLICIKI